MHSRIVAWNKIWIRKHFPTANNEMHPRNPSSDGHKTPIVFFVLPPSFPDDIRKEGPTMRWGTFDRWHPERWYPWRDAKDSLANFWVVMSQVRNDPAWQVHTIHPPRNRETQRP